MNELQNKLSSLKLKKTLVLADIESLSEVDESVFTKLGKLIAEISKIEKQIVRQTKSTFED